MQKTLIKKLQEKYGDLYDFSKVEYVNYRTKVCVICPIHGEFWILPSSLLKQKKACPKCQQLCKYTKEEFIQKAREVHGDKYDYSKVEFNKVTDKIEIICPLHGSFKQMVRFHLYGNGCPKCKKNSNTHKPTKEEFIQKAREVHGDKYDYSKVEYINSQTKVCIICPIHGEFWQMPNSHLCGRGCNLCSKPVFDTNSFILESKKIHGNKYDYSKVNYINSKTKVCIICSIHGEFWITPNNHLNGKGCALCIKEHNSSKQKLSKDEFVQKARTVHGNKYDYSKVEYINNYTKVCIICPIHGEFWQMPSKHLSKHGCSICNESYLEKEIRCLLEKEKIPFIYQARFDWLGKQSLDFYLPEHNIAIECQGEQHFYPVDFGFNDEKKAKINFLKIQENDLKKKILCLENNINLIYYANSKFQKNKEIWSIEKIINILIMKIT